MSDSAVQCLKLEFITRVRLVNRAIENHTRVRLNRAIFLVNWDFACDFNI